MPINEFPPIESADEHGLLAIGGDLTPESLELAYRQGIFPWPHADEAPIAWFSPNPRGVLFYADLKIPKSLNKLLKRDELNFAINHNFEKVIHYCQISKNRKDQVGTWITNYLKDSYIKLHQKKMAYSAEVYRGTELVGGIYGVTIGRYISGESMFYLEDNASKIALVKLIEFLHERGIDWIDTQMVTPVVENLGGKEIPRKEFIRELKCVLDKEPKKAIF